ncbi:MAG: CvpA family protein [Armatimonadota bacterium]
MTWMDAIALVLVVVVAWMESVRGFGRAIFDFVGCLIAVKVATFVAGPLAGAAPILQAEKTAEGFWIAAVFVVLVVLVIIATKFIYESTLLSLDVLDPVVGGLLGVGSGIIVAHVFLRVLMTAYGDTEFAKIVLGSFVGQELIAFRTYHRVVIALQNIGNW